MPSHDRPLTRAELAQAVQQLPAPKEAKLKATGSHASRAITFSGDAPPEVRVQPIHDVDGKTTVGWELVTPSDFTLGLNVREGGYLELPTKAPDELDAHMPPGFVIGDAVEVATPVRRRRLRRRNGARVTPEYLFGIYKREVYKPSAKFMSAHSLVGRLFVTTSPSSPGWDYTGSAALVGKRTILTAAHMVPWFHVGNSLPFKALFAPAYYDGKSVFTRADGTHPQAFCLGAWGYPGHDQGDDMAVWKLSEPLGEELGYFGYKTYTDDWEDEPWWRLNGYPGDLNNAERPARVVDFPIIDDDDDGAGVELEYEADCYHGMSGGPVWSWFHSQSGALAPYVVGTHSGSEDNPFEQQNNLAAGGSALSALIKWGRDHWG